MQDVLLCTQKVSCQLWMVQIIRNSLFIIMAKKEKQHTNYVIGKRLPIRLAEEEK